MLVRDVRADRHVDGHRQVEFGRCGEQAQVAIGKSRGRFAECASGAKATLHAGSQRRIHAPAGLIDHAEAAVVEPPLHVFARLAW
jgi:biotin synthase-related radical SAM superfamily protein